MLRWFLGPCYTEIAPMLLMCSCIVWCVGHKCCMLWWFFVAKLTRFTDVLLEPNWVVTYGLIFAICPFQKATMIFCSLRKFLQIRETIATCAQFSCPQFFYRYIRRYIHREKREKTLRLIFLQHWLIGRRRFVHLSGSDSFRGGW